MSYVPLPARARLLQVSLIRRAVEATHEDGLGCSRDATHNLHRRPASRNANRGLDHRHGGCERPQRRQ